MIDNMNRQPNIEVARDLLSPYLDGEVTDDEKNMVEQAIALYPDLNRELTSLQQTVAQLAALPRAVAPRPFTLSEADVPPEKVSGWRLFGLPMWVSGFAAAAALICVLGVSWAVLGQQFGAAPASVAYQAAESAVQEAPTAEVAREESAAEEAATEESGPPEIALNQAEAADEASTAKAIEIPAEEEMAEEPAAASEAPPEEEAVAEQAPAALSAETAPPQTETPAAKVQVETLEEADSASVATSAGGETQAATAQSEAMMTEGTSSAAEPAQDAAIADDTGAAEAAPPIEAQTGEAAIAPSPEPTTGIVEAPAPATQPVVEQNEYAVEIQPTLEPTQVPIAPSAKQESTQTVSDKSEAPRLQLGGWAMVIVLILLTSGGIIWVVRFNKNR